MAENEEKEIEEVEEKPKPFVKKAIQAILDAKNKPDK